MTSKWGLSRPATQKRQKDASRLAKVDAQERIPTADTPIRRHVSSPLADPPIRRSADTFLHPPLRSIDRIDQLAKPLFAEIGDDGRRNEKPKLIDQISCGFSESL